MSKLKTSILLILISNLCLASIWDSEYQGVQWHTNYEEARLLAVEKNLPLLIYFSGSDWCYYCKKLDKKILTKKDFQKYAQEHLILVNLDFPENKQLPAELVKQNKQLSKRFKPKGFPYFVAVSSKTDQVTGAFAFPCLPVVCSKNKFIDKIKKISYSISQNPTTISCDVNPHHSQLNCHLHR